MFFTLLFYSLHATGAGYDAQVRDLIDNPLRETLPDPRSRKNAAETLGITTAADPTNEIVELLAALGQTTVQPEVRTAFLNQVVHELETDIRWEKEKNLYRGPEHAKAGYNNIFYGRFNVVPEDKKPTLEKYWQEFNAPVLERVKNKEKALDYLIRAMRAEEQRLRGVPAAMSTRSTTQEPQGRQVQFALPANAVVATATIPHNPSGKPPSEHNTMAPPSNADDEGWVVTE